MIRDRHYNLPKFRTCNKGDNIIDYAYCSTSIFRHITGSAYEPFYLNIVSDHRGIIIDLNRQTLFGRQDTMATIATRGLNSTNEIQTESFLTYLSTLWKQSNITHRIETATSNITDKRNLRNTLNNIDKDITKALLKAEQHNKRRDRPPWSPELKEASLQVKLLKLYFRQIISKENLTASINTTKSRTKNADAITEPKTKQECQRRLRKAQKQLRQIRCKAHEK